MIRYTHTPENDSTPFGSLKVEIENPHDLNELKAPIIFRVTSSVSGKTLWETDLVPGTWSYYEMICNTTSYLLRKGEIISEVKWDTFAHGDLAHQYMMYWALENKGAQGIAIGTHNGETGEWVEPLRKGLLTATLVEASEEQFQELSVNYSGVQGSLIKKCLITPEGGPITFWETDEASYTNSVKKEHVEKFSGNLRPVIMDSVALNDLIDSHESQVTWLHLDVEGIDTDLILSISDQNISNLKLIIYETLNSSDEDKQTCKRFLVDKGFFVQESGWNTIAIRK